MLKFLEYFTPHTTSYIIIFFLLLFVMRSMYVQWASCACLLMQIWLDVVSVIGNAARVAVSLFDMVWLSLLWVGLTLTAT